MKRAISLFTAIIATSSLMANDSEIVAQDGKMKTQDMREIPCPMENHPPMRKVTPPIFPQLKSGNDVTASASFIWWKAYQNGLNYATSGSADGGTFVPVGTSTTSGNTVRPGFAFEPGFKLALGGPCLHDSWDIKGEFTWLGGNNLTSSISSGSNSGLVSLIAITLPDGTTNNLRLRNANSTYKQQFNVGDVELGRSFFISQNLILRPNLGMKTAWIHESARFNYVTNSLTTVTSGTTAVPVLSAAVIRNQNMWGLGPRLGLNGDWKVTNNFGFYGKFGMSALWSDFHMLSRDLTLTAGIGSTTNLYTRQSVIQVTPVLETAFGFAYVGWTKSEDYRFLVRASWEQQVWFDMNQMIKTQSHGNFSLQGFTLDFAVSF